MGNDGGSIPKRRELVKEAARQPTTSELKATAHESLSHAWSTCPISSQPLDPHNTVSDARGRLYNYETVLRCLMPSTTTTTTDPADPAAADSTESQEPAAFARSGIRSLKDIVKLRFHIIQKKDGNSNADEKEEIRTCPLSMKELGASTRAVYVVPCGHVFTELVMRELLAAEETTNTSTPTNTTTTTDAPVSENSNDNNTSRCPECSETFLRHRDLVPILPVDETDVEKCTARIEALRAAGLAHNLKKDKSTGGKKKRKAGTAEGKDGQTPGESGANGGGKSVLQKEKKQKRDRDDISSRINNSMTASLTAKVLAEQDERNRQRKLAAAVR